MEKKSKRQKELKNADRECSDRKMRGRKSKEKDIMINSSLTSDAKKRTTISYLTIVL